MGRIKPSFLNKSFILASFLLLFVILLFVACDSSGSSNQTEVIVKVDVIGPAGVLPQVDSILLEVSAPDVKTFERDLDVDARSIKLKIPSGTDRLLTATGGVNDS